MHTYADAYLRYSDKKQDELSIEYQMKETEEYAGKNGITIRNWYIDRAKSGQKVAGRDDFYRYMNTVHNGTAAPLLLVWRTNRAFRNAYESHKFRKILRDKNIELVSATQHIDEKTSSGRLITNILADIDQYKAEEIGDHVRAASRALVKREPRVYLGQFPIFGYKVIPWKDGDAKRQIYAIDETEAEEVKRVFADFIGGKSLFQIATDLNEKGYVTRRGKQWSYQSLHQLIKNDFYKGVRSFMVKSDSPIIIPGGVPAIIDAATWNKAQQSFDTNKAGKKPRRQKTGRVYPLTGKMKCALCGSDMCGKGGVDYQYYVCINAESRRTCTCKRLRKDAIEGYILRHIQTRYLTEDFEARLTHQVEKALAKLPQAASDKAALTAKRDNLHRELAELAQMKLNKEIDADVYAMMKAEKDALLDRVKADLLSCQDAPNPPTDAEIKKAIRALITHANSVNTTNGEMMKQLFDRFVVSVTVNKASVEVTLALSLTDILHKLPDGSPVVIQCENVPLIEVLPKRKNAKK